MLQESKRVDALARMEQAQGTMRGVMADIDATRVLCDKKQQDVDRLQRELEVGGGSSFKQPVQAPRFPCAGLCTGVCLDCARPGQRKCGVIYVWL